MALDLSPRQTALVLIDLQQGILGNALAPHPVDTVLDHATALAAACRDAGATIVPVNVAFAADLIDRLQQPVDSPQPRPANGYPPNWAELHPRIAAVPASFRITKRQWSAFHGTELDLQLRRRGITTIILGGVATNFGVESTAREAWQHNYSVVIAKDACSSVAADAHRFAIEKIFPRISRVRGTAEIVAALGQSKS